MSARSAARIVDDDGRASSSATAEDGLSEWSLLSEGGDEVEEVETEDDGFWELGDFGCADKDEEDTEEGPDAERRCDEAEAMAAMYGDDFVALGPREWLLRCDIAQGLTGEMRLRLPLDYPSRSPPQLALDVVNCHDIKEVKARLLREFQPDNEVVFTWAQCFMELCRVSAAEQQQCCAERHRTVRVARECRRDLELAREAHRLTRQPFSRRWRHTGGRVMVIVYTVPADKALAQPSAHEVAAANRRRQKEAEARARLEREARASSQLTYANEKGQNPLRPHRV